jgi:hypothetical protein
MRYYLNTSTQSKKEEGGYNEYGKKETTGTGEDAKKNAISDLHSTYATMIKSTTVQYWSGKVEDTKGNVIDKLECGEYAEAE